MNKATSEYLRILHKINENYLRYNLDDNDLWEDIEHYNDKTDYTDNELKELQNKCIIEWKKLFKLLCTELINKIESDKKYTIFYKPELKQVKKIYNATYKYENTLDQLEDLYDYAFKELRYSIEGKIAKEEDERKQKKMSYFYNILIAITFFVFGKLIQ